MLTDPNSVWLSTHNCTFKLKYRWHFDKPLAPYSTLWVSPASRNQYCTMWQTDQVSNYVTSLFLGLSQSPALRVFVGGGKRAFSRIWGPQSKLVKLRQLKLYQATVYWLEWTPRRILSLFCKQRTAQECHHHHHLLQLIVKTNLPTSIRRFVAYYSFSQLLLIFYTYRRVCWSMSLYKPILCH